MILVTLCGRTDRLPSLTHRIFIDFRRILFHTPLGSLFEKLVPWERLAGGLGFFAVKSKGEIFEVGSHVDLEKPVAPALEPLGKITGPYFFPVRWGFTVKIDVTFVGIDDMLLLTGIDAEPATGLPGGRAVLSVQIMDNDIDGAITDIFDENFGKPAGGSGAAVQLGFDLG